MCRREQNLEFPTGSDCVFYQIVHQKGKDLYILFTRWGRIGDSGNFQQTPFPHQDDAVKEFRKIFRAKTSNDWPQANRYIKWFIKGQ